MPTHAIAVNSISADSETGNVEATSIESTDGTRLAGFTCITNQFNNQAEIYSNDGQGNFVSVKVKPEGAVIDSNLGSLLIIGVDPDHNFADDTEAAASEIVPVGQLYHTNGIPKVRLA